MLLVADFYKHFLFGEKYTLKNKIYEEGITVHLKTSYKTKTSYTPSRKFVSGISKNQKRCLHLFYLPTTDPPAFLKNKKRWIFSPISKLCASLSFRSTIHKGLFKPLKF